MKLKLVKTIEEAKGTKSFFWEPEKSVAWLPGQFFYFTLPQLKYPDPRGATRHFTISASQTEGNLLRITTRIRPQSGYKQTLNELPLGSLIDGEGPNGTFILDENSAIPQVFLAGGIGITPFRSFIKYNLDKDLQIPMHLIYANSIPEEITFGKELADWSAANANIKVSLSISKPGESREPWSGHIGRIDQEMINKLIGKLSSKAGSGSAREIENSTWWLCGPPPMVDAMEDLLGNMGITSNQIHSEKFTGY